MSKFPFCSGRPSSQANGHRTNSRKGFEWKKIGILYLGATNRSLKHRIHFIVAQTIWKAISGLSLFCCFLFLQNSISSHIVNSTVDGTGYRLGSFSLLKSSEARADVCVRDFIVSEVIAERFDIQLKFIVIVQEV